MTYYISFSFAFILLITISQDADQFFGFFCCLLTSCFACPWLSLCSISGLYWFSQHTALSPVMSIRVLYISLAIVLRVPVTAAALLLSQLPVGNWVIDVKHLDGSHSASGHSYTTLHRPWQSTCWRNTVDIKIHKRQLVYSSICIPTAEILI